VAAFPDLDHEDLSGSLYELFAGRYGVAIDRGEQTLWGECADAGIARRLETETGTPLLVFRRVSWAGWQTVEHVVSRYRGDRYQLHMSLRSDRPGSAPPG
jgi:GntR family transcriptional regulator